jgi:hypothetical protein
MSMTLERIEELKRALAIGQFHEQVSALGGGAEVAELLELAEVGWKKRQQTRDSVAKVRGRKPAGEAKTSQRGRKRGKTASGEEVVVKEAPKMPSDVSVAHTAAEMRGKLEALKRERAPVKSEALAPNIPASDPLEPVFREKAVAKFPKPQESALPASFKSVLFSRVKTPGQIAHDPAATQFKTAKPRKP